MRAVQGEAPASISALGLGGARKKALLSSACRHRVVWAAAATVLLPSTQAFAQCVAAPATLSISSGSCADPAFTVRQSTDAAAVVEVSGSGAYSGVSVDLSALGSGHGVRAADDGTISLIGTPTDGVMISTYGDGGRGLYADSGGQITGSYTLVYTNGAGAHGVEAIGTGSDVTLTDSEVNTALDNAHGAYSSGGGTITLTRTSVTTYGAGASAVFADAGGSIALNDLSTYSYGDDAAGAVASGADSSLTLNNAYVNVYGSGSAGLLAADGGLITMSGGAIASGDYYGGTITADSPGMLARGGGSRILALNGATSATYGANSPGLWADAGGRIDFAGYGVFTYQPNSAGAAASGSGSTVTLTNTIVRTSGPSSAGLLVTAGGAVTASNTEITTGYGKGGSNLPVLQFPSADIGLEAHGADVVGAGSRLQTQNARITTHGDGAIGVKVSQGASASIVGGSITTNGADTAAIGGADAVRATDAASSISLSGTSVRTANINAVGLHAMTGSVIAATDAVVVTQGANAFGVSARDAGVVTLANTAVATSGDAAFGVRAGDAGTVQMAGGSVETTGAVAHGVAAVNGGDLTISGAAVAANGAGSSAIYLAGSEANAVSITGGSLSAADGAIVLSEGGTGVVSIGGGAVLNPAVVNGRSLLAQVSDDAAGVASDLKLNIADMPSLTGDIVVDASTLAYNLSNSRWTGDQRLVGPGSATSTNLIASQWTGDLLADSGNTANVSLTQGSLWTGLARNAADITIDADSAWNLTGDSSATDAVTNAGVIQFLARQDGYSTLTVSGYTGGAGSRIGFNTYLGGDASPTNLLVINGGQAGGTTTILVNNTGGPGALTVDDGIRLVQVTGGGATTADAFTLGQRVVAGAYEYQLFRGGDSDPGDWFLRSHIKSEDPNGPGIPIYRPEAPLYAPVPAIARQMALSTLGTLHERVGDQENLRGLVEPRAYVNGAWGRLFGARLDNRWGGTAEARAEGDLVGFQTGLDLFRRATDRGRRDHVGLYVAYTDHDASMRGLARGMRDLEVGRLQTDGSSVGAYWTHFGPTGWYVDTVLQQSWYDMEATSLYGSGASTETTGYTWSLETGYPITLRESWLVEPQAQIVYQNVRVDGTQDQYSSVDWDEGVAWTGRFGARLQHTRRDARGILWQPYGRINLWHAFSGKDSVLLGQSGRAIESRFGHTALEVGGGLTARVSTNVSLYGQASHRWTVDGDRSRQTATEAALGLRING
ncbi:autotransporter outer membrane beta-barrel domain-containing protein [Brevundimonas diminuta]|uniref:autotransporter outer membrane beta-barrel domain-containing protein n=1 Tax=Brevundimonas diminuta TaxID=293 RepID=UPI0028AEEE02|nr:autotransporter outer membrane beta-barrel domain-containing protein [Brevundimonas diminuta]